MTTLFSSRASHYTRFRPDYPDALIAFVSSLAKQHRVAWDCATGNGQAATALAKHFDHVIGTDASPEQIREARSHANVEYRVASAEDSGLDTASADLVTVAQALHWFDQPRFYKEAKRVLVSEGAIAIWTYGDPSLDHAPSDALLQRFNKGTMGQWWPKERGAVGAVFLDAEFPFREVVPPAFTLERSWTVAELAGYLRSWSAVARYQAANNGQDPVAPFEVELARAWGSPDERHTIRWPITMRAGYR